MPSAQHVSWARFRVLAVSVAALLILGTITYLLTGGTVLQPKTVLYLYLDDATGLSSDSPVRVDGIGVGKVDLVELSGSNDPLRVVRVSLKVESDRLASISADSTAQITSDSPIGDKFVDITSGVSPQHIASGGEIRYKGAPELMKSIDLAQFEKQVQSIQLLLDDIDEGRTPLGQFIAGDDLYKELNRRVQLLQTKLHDAADTTGAVGRALYTDALDRQVAEPLKKLDDSLAKLQSGQGSMGQLLRDNRQYEQTRTQVADLRRSIGSMRGAEMMATSQAHDAWVKQVASIMRTVEAFNAAPLLTGSGVYENFDGMAREMQRSVKEFRENPKKYLWVKVF